MNPFQSFETRRAGRAAREGYISLLAVTFAFGVATVATVMAVSLRSYSRAAVGQERAILDGISLDSASAQLLGVLAEGEKQPIAPWNAPFLEINGRMVMVHVSMPEGKYDLAMDGSQLLARELEKQNLPNGLPSATEDRTRGLAETSRLLGLDASAEDCLRQRFTLGRAPGEYEPLAAQGSLSKVRREVRPGDQVDLRVAIRRNTDTEVLWERLRFTGGQWTWRVHDYRRLRLKHDAKC